MEIYFYKQNGHAHYRKYWHVRKEPKQVSGRGKAKACDPP